MDIAIDTCSCGFYWFILYGVVLVLILGIGILSDWFSRYFCLLLVLFISSFWYGNVCLGLFRINFNLLYIRERGEGGREGRERGERFSTCICGAHVGILQQKMFVSIL